MDRERTRNSALVWVLEVALAAVFVLAGVSKLLGTETFVLQAAAMRGFPDWIRVVVGVCEIVGGIALLIPGLTTNAALALAVLMIPATITQRISGQPGILVPVVLFLLLLLLAERREPVVVRNSFRSVADTPHPILRKGVVAGVIGATCVAVWFFIVDMIAGQPLFTPATLGHALLTVLKPTPEWANQTATVIAYTVFHYLAFIGIGIIAAVVASWASTEPAIIIGFIILAVAFEVGFYGLVAVLQLVTPLGALAWYQVMIGNLIAAVAMGTYLWRVHPLLREQLTHAFDVPRG
jgi:putative oxidoreductase